MFIKLIFYGIGLVLVFDSRCTLVSGKLVLDSVVWSETIVYVKTF